MPLVLRSVDLQIEAAPGKKPNGQILKPRAQACESYAYLPRGSIRELMGPFWPEDASLSATRRSTRPSKLSRVKCEDRSSCVRMPAARKLSPRIPWVAYGDAREILLACVKCHRPALCHTSQASRLGRPDLQT